MFKNCYTYRNHVAATPYRKENEVAKQMKTLLVLFTVHSTGNIYYALSNNHR